MANDKNKNNKERDERDENMDEYEASTKTLAEEERAELDTDEIREDE